jgi:hypothetical protein
MQIQVGKFVCTLSIGEVEATWQPWQPRYLSRDERAQYRAGRAAFLEARATGERFRGGGLESSVRDTETAAIPLVLPSLQAMALAQFVKRVDFETIVRFAPVTVACDDGKSEADLVWLAVIALRGALAEAASNRVEGDELSSRQETAEVVTKSPAEMEEKAPLRHPLLGALKGLAQIMPGTDLTKPADLDWSED